MVDRRVVVRISGAMALGGALLVGGPASAEEPLTWTVTVAGKAVGERTLEVVEAGRPGRTVRVLDMRTTLDGSVVGQPLDYRQRIDGVAGRTPASFHAVIVEAGEPRELQAQYSTIGWTITRVDRRQSTTVDADAGRIAMSTVDLFDPGNRTPLGRFETVGMLSAETGDVWEGKVEPLGHRTVTIAGQKVGVDGWSWTTPEGKHEFWYDPQGVLVRYATRVLGIKVEGLLTAPPPPGPDDFPVRAGRADVDIEDLG